MWGDGKCQESDKGIRTVSGVFEKNRHNEPMIGLMTALRGNPLRSSGVDGRREPVSGIGYMQDRWTRWPDDGWVEPDSVPPNTVQLTGRKRRAGSRSAVKQISNGAVLRRDNQWVIPRKHALFRSDRPDNTTSGSDILEGHYDRPPEQGYSDLHNTGRPHDVHVTEELCSPSEHLEKGSGPACSKILQITARSSCSIGHRLRRSLLGLRNGRGLRRRQFLDFQGS